MHFDLVDRVLELSADRIVTLKHADGSSDSFEVTHTFNAEQIAWFKAGSALNLMK